MKKLLMSLALGAVIGIIEVVLMMFQKVDWYSNVSTFIHWVVLSVIIYYTRFSMKGWIKGIILAELTALPIIALIVKTEPMSVLPIMVLSAVFGSIIGVFGDKYEKE